jgi:hypothetical protein
MANWGGAAKGAASGAAVGSAFGPWGTAIGGALGGIGGLFSSDEEKEAAESYNQWMKDTYGEGGSRQKMYDQMIAEGKNPFGPQITQNWGTEQQQMQRNMHQRTIMERLVGKGQEKGKEALEKQVFGRLGKPAVTEGEMMRRLQNETKLQRRAEESARDQAGMRGLGAKQAMGGTMGLAADRAGRLSDILASRPEMERSRQFQNEAAAQSLLRDWMA